MATAKRIEIHHIPLLMFVISDNNWFEAEENSILIMVHGKSVILVYVVILLPKIRLLQFGSSIINNTCVTISKVITKNIKKHFLMLPSGPTKRPKERRTIEGLEVEDVKLHLFDVDCYS
jgi:hypothetical protein